MSNTLISSSAQADRARRQAAVLLIIIPFVFLAIRILHLLRVIRWSFSSNTAVSLSCAAVLLAAVMLAGWRKWLLPSLPLIAGLALSVAGDYFMGAKQGDPMLYVMAIGFFFLAHAVFTVYYCINGKKSWLALGVLLLLLAGYGWYYFTELMPKIHDDMLAIAAGAYILVSACTLASSFMVRYPWPIRLVAIAGVLLLIISDTLIAENDFIYRSKLYFLMLPFYVGSHFLMTTAAILNMARRPGADKALSRE